MKQLAENISDNSWSVKFISRNECRLIVESKNESISKLEKFLYQLRDYLMIDEKIFTNILISLTEAVNNSITHGNNFRPGTYVWIYAYYSKNSIVFSVEDEGRGFDYSKIEDPTIKSNITKTGGRGIYLMQTFADSMQYSKDGKTVKLFFYFNRPKPSTSVL